MNARCWRPAVALFLVALPFAKAEQQGEVATSVESKVGMEGVYYLRYGRAGLVPLPANERSAVVVRIANVVQDNDSYLYEVRYIGAVAGEHDLRDHLARADGQPLTDLPPLKVAVRGVLADGHDGAIEPLASTAGFWTWPYRAMLEAGLIIWIALAGVVLVRRLFRRRAKAAVSESAPLTLADELLPLVEAASAGNLSVSQKARLEMLLLAHWRSKLKLTDVAPANALRFMRSHETAGKLLAELESWLHARPGVRKVDVTALLAPYRTAAAVGLESPQSPGSAS